MLAQIREDLFKPHMHLGSFLLRLGLASIFFFHGYLKLQSDWGRSWSNVVIEGKELHEATQMAVAWGETICGAAMFLGLLSRLAAIGLTVIMVGAIVLQTGRYDFIRLEYIKSDPGRVPTGAEYNVALIVMCLAVLALGSGKVSLDYLLWGRRGNT
jgi:uncharacterized membrane protein YphA (DoxX/SURF4 family)